MVTFHNYFSLPEGTTSIIKHYTAKFTTKQWLAIQYPRGSITKECLANLPQKYRWMINPTISSQTCPQLGPRWEPQFRPPLAGAHSFWHQDLNLLSLTFHARLSMGLGKQMNAVPGSRLFCLFAKKMCIF